MQERGFDFSKITAGAKLFTFLLTVILLVTYRKDYVGAAMGMIFGNILYDLFLLYQYREFLTFGDFNGIACCLRECGSTPIPIF